MQLPSFTHRNDASGLSGGAYPSGSALSRYRSLHWFLAIVTGAMLLLIPAFLNGYPLVNSDVGAYVLASATGNEPIDRPLAYSILIRLFSLGGTSLWWVCVCQAFILSGLLVHTARRSIAAKPAQAALAVAFVALLTSASWITSELIPDVFTPIALLSLYLILLHKERLPARLALYLLFAAAIGTHVSHVMIFGLLCGFCLLHWLWIRFAAKKARPLLPVLIPLLLTIASVGWILKPVRESGHIFSMAVLVDHGILKTYLQEHCNSASLNLCKYKDSLTRDPNFFMWEPGSPVYQEGGWHAVKPEYDRIIHETWTSPRYLRMRLAASLGATGEQMILFRIGDGNVAFGRESHVHNIIGLYCPQDTAQYARAVQQNKDWPSPIFKVTVRFNVVINVIVVISLLILLGSFIFRRRSLPPSLQLFLALVFAGTLLNLWNCATFAQVNGRYGCRMMWLVPFAALLCVLALWRRKGIMNNE